MSVESATGGRSGRDDDRLRSPLTEHLRTGCALFGLDVGLVALVDGDRLVVRACTDPTVADDRAIGLAPAGPVADTLAGRCTVASHATDTTLGPWPVRAWLGKVVRSEGHAYLLAFVGWRPRDLPFGPADVAVVEVMADAVALFLRASEAEDAQRRSEATNRAILSALPDLLFRYDGRGTHLGGWAGRPEDLFVPLEEAIGRRVADVLAPELAERWMAAIAAALADGSLQTLRYAGEAGGELRHFEARMVRCGPDEVLAIVRNVTEAVRAGEALAVEAGVAAVVAEVASELQSSSPAGLDRAVTAGLGRVAGMLGAARATLSEEEGRSWRWGARDGDACADLAVRLGGGTGQGGLLALGWDGDAPGLPDGVVPVVRVFGEALLGAIARCRAELAVEGQAAVLEVIARGAPLTSTLAAAARLVERHAEDLHAAVLVVGTDGRTVRALAAPSFPPELDAHLRRLPLDGPLTPWALSLETAQPVTVTDLASDDRFPACRDLAAQLGIGATWSVPVVSARSGDVLGTVVTVAPAGREPTVAERQVQESSAALAAIAVERAVEEAALAFQATHDALTKVANRTVLLDRLGLALARSARSGRPVTLLFCDLDRFKAVNDRFGHDQGDQLLVAVAERLTAAMRPTDTVARVGGDEFVVLCEDADGIDDALRLADRVAAAVQSTPFPLGSAEVAVTVSIGVALSTAAHDHPEALLRDADEAMYRAKAGGRARRELFEEGIRRATRRRARLAEELATAVAADQLVVHYQPVVSLRDGRVRAAEALVRWRHPVKGLLLPGEFVPVAESTGLIVPVGRWLLDAALDQLGAWCRDDPDLSGRLAVHVNISARQLLEPDFLLGIEEGLARTGLHPSVLCLELTEGALMDQAPAAAAAVDALIHLGVPLALDDFGTGDASLTFLRAVPVTALKVDGTFVSGLGKGAEDDAIVAAVIDLAHALGLEAVAEGVETDEQLACLRRLGCDAAQGYRLAGPGPAEAVTAALGHRFL